MNTSRSIFCLLIILNATLWTYCQRDKYSKVKIKTEKDADGHIL